MAGLLGPATEPGHGLRHLLDSGEMVLAPGCYDALGARLVEEAGFGGVHDRLWQRGVVAWPTDVGLMTLPEMADNARRIVGAVDIPVIADADTGYESHQRHPHRP